MTEPLLQVDHLTTGFPGPSGTLVAVNDVSFAIAPGETLCLVGESGSGKSLTAFSILRLVPAPGRILGGSIRFGGRDLLALQEDEMCAVRGADIALIFQEPMTALNPVFRVGDQIAESLVVHGRMNWRAARARGGATDGRRPHPGCRRARPRLPPSALRRSASAGAHRDGPGLQTGARDCRRADHGARRHHTGPDPRSAPATPGRARARPAVDYPRPRRGRRDGRPRRRHVRRTDRRAGPGGCDLREPAASRTRRGCWRRCLESGVWSPEAGRARGKRLQAIDGTVPTLANLPQGCAFEPRCVERVEVCRQAMPRTGRARTRTARPAASMQEAPGDALCWKSASHEAVHAVQGMVRKADDREGRRRCVVRH